MVPTAYPFYWPRIFDLAGFFLAADLLVFQVFFGANPGKVDGGCRHEVDKTVLDQNLFWIHYLYR